MSQEDVIKILLTYIELLKQAGIPVQKAYLYGSYARNEATESSDIDVMLVSDIFDTDDDYILSKPWAPACRIDYRIEPIAVGAKRFLNDDISPIIQIVKQEGVEIST